MTATATSPRPTVPATAQTAVRRPRRVLRPGRPRFLWLVTALVLLFLAAPLFVVSAFSFNSTESLSSFESASLRWYESVFSDSAILESIEVSLIVAGVTTVVALALGTGLAIAFVRGRARWTRPVQATALLTLVTPEIATAIGLLTLFSFVGTGLSTLTVILGHITFALAFVTVIVRSRLLLLDPALEDAAMDLGATRLETFRFIVVPQLTPALLGAGLLVFVLSFDDFVTSLFLSGTDVAPLPVRIYGMLRFGLTPEVNAIGTIMMVASVGLGLLGIWFLNRRTRRRVGAGPADVIP